MQESGEKKSASASVPVTTTVQPSPKTNPNEQWSEALSTFLLGMDDYRPTIPEAATQYYASKAGVSADDPRVIKFLSLAADKLLCDIINDSRQFALLRQRGVTETTPATTTTTSKPSGTGKRKGGPSADKIIPIRDIFAMEDLQRSLEQRNIFVRRKIGVTADVSFAKKPTNK